jgi:hypothetical protein
MRLALQYQLFVMAKYSGTPASDVSGVVADNLTWFARLPAGGLHQDLAR